MPGLLKGLGAGLLALLAAVLGLAVLGAAALGAALVAFDGNDAKPYVARQLSAALGREVRIEGDLQIDPGLETRIVAHGIRVADAPWAPRPYMAEVPRLLLRVDLRALAQGDLRLREIAVDQPALTLESAADGRRNWAFATDGDDTDGAPLVPLVDRLRVNGGVLTYIDGARALRTQTVFDGATGSLTGPARALEFQASGTVDDVARLELMARADALMPPGDRPYPVQAEIRLAGARATAEGSIAGAEDGAGRVELDLLLEVPDLATLRSLVPWELPDWPSARIEARAVREGTRMALQGIRARLGESDLAGRISADTGGERPRIEAVLESRTLDIVQLTGRPSEQPGPVIPTEPIPFEHLHAFDAALRYQARTVYVPQMSLENVTIGLAVEGGVLRADPLVLEIGDGRIRSNELRIDARRQPVVTTADIAIEQLGLNALLQEFDVDARAFGTLEGGVDLTGRGPSAAAILGSADGSIELIMQGGQFDALLSAAAGQDITEVLEALALEAGATTELRCFIADFDATDGVLSSRTLVLDAANSMIVGAGDVDLDAQRVNLAFLPQHKEATPLAAQAPVHINGDLNDIQFAVDTGAAVASLITPIELPDADDADCRALAEAARQSE